MGAVLQDSDLDFASVAKMLNVGAPFASGHVMRYDEFGATNYNQMGSGGAPTFSLANCTGLPVAGGGTGQSTWSNGQIPIGNAGSLSKATLTGAANQVIVTNGAGSITLSLPQSIATTSAVTFGAIGLGIAGGTNSVFEAVAAGGTQGFFSYDSTHKCGISVASTGDTSFNITGGSQFILNKGMSLAGSVIASNSQNSGLVNQTTNTNAGSSSYCGFGITSDVGAGALAVYSSAYVTSSIRSTMGIFTTSPTAMFFGTNAVEVMRISGTGFNILHGVLASPSGGTYNYCFGGPTTSPGLGGASFDQVNLGGIDNGAGNREFQRQPESGGLFAEGNNKYRRVPSATQDVYHWTTTVNTTDGTQTTLATVPIIAGRTYLIEARVAARRTGGASGTADDGASYVRRASYTTKSGTVTLLGSVQTIGTDAEDQAGWDITHTISGSNVLVRVTGAAANNITWMGDITVQSVAS